ncbi:MAG: TonB-dependent receptor [Sphingomonas bacterium]|nr:TonB-dependent receptor [Sphingomonas bacterium]
MLVGTSRNLFLGTMFAAALVGGAAAPEKAVAQTSPPAARPVETVPEDDGSRVQDIIVTAQRREERLQDVPVSVSVLTGSAVRNAGVRDVGDLSVAVPGLDLGRQNIAIAPFIRGVGNKNTSPGEEAATAIYVDGVYLPTLTGGLFALSNIQRVEVLKGPQGTLFGRNATAGVIQIITKDPKVQFSGDASIGYGNYDTVEANFYATSGIAPGVRADIALYGMKQRDGWGKNLTTGNDVYKGYDFAARSKWIFDLGPKATLKIAGDFESTRPVATPAFRPMEGKMLAGGVPYSGFYNVAENIDVFATSRQWGLNGQLRYDLGWADVVSITSYRHNKVHWVFDQDGTPANLVSPISDETASTWTQELQLVSEKNSTFEWIAGFYYYNDRSAEAPLTLQGLVLPVTTLRYSTQTAESFAGFTQGTFHLPGRTDLTGGLRYTYDKRTIFGEDVRSNGTTLNYPKQDANFEKLTWRASIDHRLSDQILTYASYSRGFKSGVFNVIAPAGAAVRPEIVDSYEVGFKSDLFDRAIRLNGAAFYNKFRDIQFQVPVVGGTALLNAAAARTQGFELELQAVPSRGLTLRAALTYLDGKYTNFKNAPFYTQLPAGGNAAFTGDAGGNNTIQTSPFTASVGADYQINGAFGALLVAATYYYNDGFFFDPQNRVAQPSYSILNSSLEYTLPGGRLGMKIWVRNLLEARYYTNVTLQSFGDDAFPAAPRTFGASVAVHF